MRKSDYLGQVVKLQAEYKTDNMTYSYFFDKSCATENVISPGYFRPSETPGLEQFLAEGKRRCKGRGICSLTAHVELVAQVLEEEDGDIYLDIKNVERFSYE